MSRWANSKPDAKLLQFMYAVSALSCAQIGEMYGVSRQTVSLWLKQAGIPVRRRGRPEEQANEPK